jgi:hypothetical protein
MNSHDGWGFFYFWALFSLATLNGNAVSRILAYCLPNNDVAQTLGPAILLLFILTAGYSPQYLQLPAWLRWISWISPCAYCYEGAIVNEVFKRQVGGIPGTEFAQEELGIPRVPYDTAPAGLSTEELVMAFDAYMLFVLTIVFESKSIAFCFSPAIGLDLICLFLLSASCRVLPLAPLTEMVWSNNETIPGRLWNEFDRSSMVHVK